MKYCIILMSYLFWLTSCTNITLIANDPEAYKDLNFHIAGKEAVVKKIDGQQQEINITAISIDSLYGSSIYFNQIENSPTNTIQEIAITGQNSASAITWGLIGGIAGFLGGFIIVAAATEDLAAGGTGAILGGLIGGISGAYGVASSTERYILSTENLPLLEKSKFKKVESSVRIDLEKGIKEEGNLVIFRYKDKIIKIPKDQVRILDQNDSISLLMPRHVYLQYFK